MVVNYGVCVIVLLYAFRFYIKDYFFGLKFKALLK